MVIFGEEDGAVVAESDEVSMDKGTNSSRGRVGRRGTMRYCGVLSGDAGSTGTIYIGHCCKIGACERKGDDTTFACEAICFVASMIKLM